MKSGQFKYALIRAQFPITQKIIFQLIYQEGITNPAEINRLIAERNDWAYYQFVLPIDYEPSKGTLYQDHFRLSIKKGNLLLPEIKKRPPRVMQLLNGEIESL